MASASALIRNNEAGPTVFEYDGGKSKVEWAGAGDPMGNDLRPVPVTYLEDVQFVQAINAGIFSVEEAPEELTRTLTLQRQQWANRQAQAKAASEASLDQAPGDDMLMLGCIGPSAKGQGTCGVQVAVKSRAKNEHPPLCVSHKSLAGQFLAEESTKLVDGKPDVTWIRAVQGSRAKQD